MVPIFETNAAEMSIKIRSLQCDLGVMRGALDRATQQALTGFTGPERDQFAVRCGEIRRMFLDLEASLDGVPGHIESAGDEVMHARRSAAARAMGPGAVVADEVAKRLGW